MSYLSKDPQIMSGKLVIKGTRIPVSRIIFLMTEGYTLELIKEEYPHVSLKTLKGAIDELRDNIDRPYAP